MMTALRAIDYSGCCNIPRRTRPEGPDRRCFQRLNILRVPMIDVYGWRNGGEFTKFIFIHIQCSYCYSRIYLFTFNNRIYIQEIYLFTFTCVFLIHDYICSHLRDVFIHIQRVISIHIHDRNIHSAFSAHHLCASLGPSSRSTISERNMADGG